MRTRAWLTNRPPPKAAAARGAPASKSGGAPETTGELIPPEQAYDTGWLGSRNTPHADEEYAMTSGPESPGARDVEDE